MAQAIPRNPEPKGKEKSRDKTPGDKLDANEELAIAA